MSESWMRRLIFQAYCFVLGVIAGKLRPMADAHVPFLYGLFVLLLAVSLFGYVRSRRGNFPAAAATLLLGLSAFFLGWGRYSATFSVDDPRHISKYTTDSYKQNASVEGVIITDPRVFADRIVFTLNPIRVRPEGPQSEFEEISGGRVEVSIRRTAKELYDEFGNSGVYGWRIRVNAPLLIPPAEINPHGFSYRDFLADQDIYGVQTITASWGSPPPVETLDRGDGFFLIEWALTLKEKIMGVFVRTIPYPQSTFLAGVTLGVDEVLQGVKCIVPSHDWMVLDECRVAGVTHVLAVSGQHVTIISGMLLAILSSFKIPIRIQAPIIILCLVIFLIITGMPPSAMRATLMNSLVIFFLAMSKGGFQASLMFGIAEAAAVVLFVNPKNIVQPAFTLSFAAVLSLGLISFPLERLFSRLRGAPFLYIILALVLVTVLCAHPFYDTISSPAVHLPLAAALIAGFVWCRQRFEGSTVLDGLAYERLPDLVRLFAVAQGAILIGMMYPLSAYYFGRYALAGPYANLIAIPLTGFMVPVGLLAGLIGQLSDIGLFLALILNATNNCLTKLFFYTVHYSTEWFPFPFVKNLTTGQLGLYYASVAVFVWWERIHQYGSHIYFKFYKHAQDPRLRRNVAGIAMAAAALILMAAYKAVERPAPVPDGILRIVFFSTSYGGAAAIQTPTGKTYLVDGGLNNPKTHSDVGQKVLAPFLLKQGIKTIDAVILTNAGPEHTEGLGSIVEGFDVRKIYDPAPIANFRQFGEMAAKLPTRAYETFLEDIGDDRMRKNRQAPHVRRVYDGYAKIAREAWRKDIPRTRAAFGQVVEKSDIPARGGGTLPFRLHFIGPIDPFSDLGNQSAALKLEFGSFSVLFPGDIGPEGAESLLSGTASDPELLESDIWIVPDHAKNPAARDERILDAVKPDAAVAQSGNYSLFYGKGREAKPLVDRAKEEYDAAKTFYQDRLGTDRFLDPAQSWAVVVESDGKKYRIESLREKKGR